MDMEVWLQPKTVLFEMDKAQVNLVMSEINAIQAALSAFTSAA
jgi:hypothetical protein